MRKGIRSALGTTNKSASSFPRKLPSTSPPFVVPFRHRILVFYHTHTAGRVICYSWSSVSFAWFGCSFFPILQSSQESPQGVIRGGGIGYLVSGYVFKRLGVVGGCCILGVVVGVVVDCECSRPHAVIFPLLLLLDLGASFNLGSLLLSSYSISHCSLSEQDLWIN